MNLSRNLSLILGGCTSLTYLAASFIPLWTVERFGRRALLIFSAAGLSLCFILAAILLSFGTKSTAYGATAMVFIFQIFLGIGWLPIPWFYPSEVCTTRIRSRGQALGAFINWMCGECISIIVYDQHQSSGLTLRTYSLHGCPDHTHSHCKH
jgi:MFS family permease